MKKYFVLTFIFVSFLASGIVLSQDSNQRSSATRFPALPQATFRRIRVNSSAWLARSANSKVQVGGTAFDTTLLTLNIHGTFGGRFDGANRGELRFAADAAKTGQYAAYYPKYP